MPLSPQPNYGKVERVVQEFAQSTQEANREKSAPGFRRRMIDLIQNEQIQCKADEYLEVLFLDGVSSFQVEDVHYYDPDINILVCQGGHRIFTHMNNIRLHTYRHKREPNQPPRRRIGFFINDQQVVSS